MIDFEYINKDFCSYKPGMSLKEQTRSIPNKYGVYIFRKNTRKGEILYIGKSGTIKQDGHYKRQNLNKRINGKSSAQTQRERWFLDKFQEDPSMKIIYIEWYELDEEKFLPGYVESCLLQKFFCETKKLPLWNKEY